MDTSIHSVVAAQMVQDRIATATVGRRTAEVRRARRRRPRTAGRALDLARAVVERTSVAALQ
jgi:hypothetical protein